MSNVVWETENTFASVPEIGMLVIFKVPVPVFERVMFCCDDAPTCTLPKFEDVVFTERMGMVLPCPSSDTVDGLSDAL